uniref:hypothetical protein n=1 Tax=Ningiella ruwaisensis TaxID=2364274 RepID=UPI0010A0BC2E|nr:hypothetical protein [Ningiella ruwaisensis]
MSEKRWQTAYAKCYMPLKISAFIVFISLTSFQAVAGGSTFRVKIENLLHDTFKFRFIARVIDNFNYDNSGCEIIDVSGYYDADKWKNRNALINQKIHSESLLVLEAAFENDSEINLGYIGNGFFNVGDCKYVSKGLFHDEQGVYSIYVSI